MCSLQWNIHPTQRRVLPGRSALNSQDRKDKLLVSEQILTILLWISFVLSYDNFLLLLLFF